MGKRSKIYGSSQEFLNNIDTITPSHEACFATSRHHLLPIEQENLATALHQPVISNKSVKILDKNHNNSKDNIFTVLTVLAYVLLTNIKYWIIFFATSYIFCIYFAFKFVKLC